MRALVASTRTVIRKDPCTRDEARACLAAAEAWVAQPTKANRALARRAVVPAKQVLAEAQPPHASLQAALAAARSVDEKGEAHLAAAFTALGDPLAFMIAIRDEVSAWALGYSDPVAERVEALEDEPAGG